MQDEVQLTTATDVRRHVLPPQPPSVAQARAFVAAVLDRWGQRADLIETARLIVSELVTNAIIHTSAEADVEVTLTHGVGSIRLEVADRQQRLRPRLTRAAPTAESGRGLEIVAALADDWGVVDTEDGRKVVWCEVYVGDR